MPEEEKKEIVEEAVKEKKPKRDKLIYRTVDNDIKYHAPLNYRHLRIIAWAVLAIAQIGILLTIAAKFDKPNSESLLDASNIFSFFSNFPLPLFMLANFAFILRGTQGYKRLLIFYGGVALLLYAIAVFITTHYVFGIALAIDETASWIEFANAAGTGFVQTGKSTYYIFNIFIDLFLCALTYFFLNYTPKNFFQGKKIVIFRLFVILPILYEAGTFVLKYFADVHGMPLNYLFFFLLTAKPPFMFLAFLIIALLLRYKNYLYVKKFGTEKSYEEHINTNAHALSVSITTAIVFAICSVLDFLVIILFAFIYARNHGGISVENLTLGALYGYDCGLGASTVLVLVIPFVFLFSYRNTPKRPEYDKYIPVIGIGLIVFIYIEGLYQIGTHKLEAIIDMITGDSEVPSNTAALIHMVKDGVRNIIHH